MLMFPNLWQVLYITHVCFIVFIATWTAQTTSERSTSIWGPKWDTSLMFCNTLSLIEKEHQEHFSKLLFLCFIEESQKGELKIEEGRLLKAPSCLWLHFQMLYWSVSMHFRLGNPKLEKKKNINWISNEICWGRR